MCLVVLSVNSSGQCTIDELFPVGIGQTKFQAINLLNFHDGFFDVEDNYRHWSKPEYLNGDSIFFSYVNYKYETNLCVKSTDNIGKLSFVDDYLYKMTIIIRFPPNELEACLNSCNSIFNSCIDEFPFYEEFVSKDEETKEQVGEGYWMYRFKSEAGKEKFEEISVGYRLEYEKEWDSNNNEMFKTGKIDGYVLEVRYVHLKGTKLKRYEY